MVRTAPSARSTDADMSPTRAWALVVALRMRRAEKPMLATATEIMSRVRPSNSGSMIAMAITEPKKMSAPPAASMRP